MGIVGDFSFINPFGVRVRVFPCGVSGLRVARNSGLGLRVFRDSGLGLRVRSPDDHVILLIPLYPRSRRFLRRRQNNRSKKWLSSLSSWEVLLL